MREILTDVVPCQKGQVGNLPHPRQHRSACGWTSSGQAISSDQANKTSYGFCLSGPPAPGLPFLPTRGPFTVRDGRGPPPEFGVKIVWNIDGGSDAHAINYVTSRSRPPPGVRPVASRCGPRGIRAYWTISSWRTNSAAPEPASRSRLERAAAAKIGGPTKDLQKLAATASQGPLRDGQGSVSEPKPDRRRGLFGD
jgi:hypothetical protein